MWSRCLYCDLNSLNEKVLRTYDKKYEVRENHHTCCGYKPPTLKVKIKVALKSITLFLRVQRKFYTRSMILSEL